MKLEYIQVAGYKNLIDTRLLFETSEMPITLIGNNGTGKSNLIEALLHIFIGLYYGKPPGFDFHIRYSAHNKKIEVRNSVQNNMPTVTVDGTPWRPTQFYRRIRSPQQMPPFPSQVFTYYSGTCDRVENIIKKYNRRYLRKLKKQSDDLERQFVFSDISQAEWILLGLIAHRHHTLLQELGIDDIHGLRLTLQPPPTYIRDQDDPVYWGTRGGVREFLADLDNAEQKGKEPLSTPSSRSGRATRVYRIKKEQLEEIGMVLQRRGTNLYSMLQALAKLGILIGNEFDVIHQGTRTHYGTESLSEGEKQLLCVIGGLTLAQNNECLVLLDEPDTHLNPAWSWRYESLLKRALTPNQQATSTTIIATHDPIMISGQVKEQVFIARKAEERLVYESPVRNPRGQGVANILVSEYFGLPSSLDEHTQMLLDERLRLAYKQERLTQEQSHRLKEINEQLEILGLSISFRDPAYKEFEEQKYGDQEGQA